MFIFVLPSVITFKLVTYKHPFFSPFHGRRCSNGSAWKNLATPRAPRQSDGGWLERPATETWSSLRFPRWYPLRGALETVDGPATRHPHRSWWVLPKTRTPSLCLSSRSLCLSSRSSIHENGLKMGACFKRELGKNRKPWFVWDLFTFCVFRNEQHNN